MSVVDEQFILHDEALDELYNWLDTIPLSRPKKNISRDFSDGVLCAEIVAHFQPKAVDMHNYFPASSVMQKKINWNTLNRKVFAKYGIRMNDVTIQQLIEAKPGAIEQLLWDIRRKMHTTETSGRNDYRGNSRRMDSSPGPRARSVGASPYEHESSLGYRSSVHEHQHDYSDEPPITVIRGASKIPTSSSIGKPPATAPSGGSYANSYHTQGYAGQGYASGPKPTTSYASTEASNNNSATPPSQIIYRGHKMVPLALIEEREREIKSLEAANKTLVTKVNRVETLVSVKDQRIEDLTHQLHNVRTLYERVTQQTWSGY